LGVEELRWWVRVEALTANNKSMNMLLCCDCELSVKSVIFTFVDIREEVVGKVLYFSVQTFYYQYWNGKTAYIKHIILYCM